MTKKRILVIDDEPSFTRLLKLNLEYNGHYVVKEENFGTRGVATIKEFKPDLSLLDVMMPGIDGGQIAQRLQDEPALQRIPIIFLTAAVKKTEVGSGSGQIGGFPYLAKPVDMDELAACIELHLPK